MIKDFENYPCELCGESVPHDCPYREELEEKEYMFEKQKNRILKNTDRLLPALAKIIEKLRQHITEMSCSCTIVPDKKTCKTCAILAELEFLTENL